MSDTIRRHALYEHARDTWGTDSAETLMDLLPSDLDALATKTDVGLAKADLQVDLAEVRSEMAQLGGDLRAEMAQQTRLLMITMLTSTVTILLAVVFSS